ncbi:MAG: NADH-ubiquinone oxidoreductase-F iron-sulfur binding region domain-containing protein [Bacteroidales bacterium]|jgi:[NiFe] hydrogenase diaphorase moiety large subunit|nr:NADH-ubiquinone oxidoreductase-F iron-sulfur binding region domain-containing protein [Bacteroidales bacterium]HOL98390.1 NADH-ubiquinone oxidoreductase-F iron-sulfur binding region domain-containing protein [Bacteroidales bacterium]HOM37283.1 NADH-ubiquinone oxidoreductase-F iron-sulfur binding region domain-containing protein [Bacteroidales bacterium]HPD24838.1 NADH-ubiquinone oxidoreductase-F iron-sulfur binding region domain-containing protein [Bacteroidales bacterium]HRS99560.1 NADH-ubi
MEKNRISKVDLIFENDGTLVNTVLDKVKKMNPDDIIMEMIDSGLKGRGGAGFPTGLKWKFTKAENSYDKYVVCNADEGEPGTFKDREILDRVPEKVFTGMAVAGYAIGARKGYMYLRAEYNFLLKGLIKKVEEFNKLLKDKGFDFNIEIRSGAGAYICGEESALFESIEGKRGEPRNKPPYPTVAGLFNKPTSINNVETLVYATVIMKYGAEKFKEMGTKDSRGSKVFSISGDTPNAGIYELELGMTVAAFVDEFGDGDTKAVQVGGASGICVPRKKFNDMIIGYEGVPTGGSMMLFNSSRSMYNVLKDYLEFFAEESCGQCTPCRVGCQQLLRGIEAVKKGEKDPSYLETLKKLAQTMKISAKCGLGQSVANPFISIVDNFREEIIY